MLMMAADTVILLQGFADIPQRRQQQLTRTFFYISCVIRRFRLDFICGTALEPGEVYGQWKIEPFLPARLLFALWELISARHCRRVFVYQLRIYAFARLRA
jgi:hypothetical protein